jgi:hypothetical protein
LDAAETDSEVDIMKYSFFALAAFALIALTSCALAAYTATIEAPITDATLYSGGHSYITRSASFDGKKGQVALRVENLTKAQISYPYDSYGSYWATGSDIGQIVSSSYVTVGGGSIADVKSFRRLWNESVRSERAMSLGEVLNASLGKTVTFNTAKGARSGKLLWYSDKMVGIAGDAGLVMASIDDISELSTPSLASYSTFDETNTSKSSYGVDLFGSLDADGKSPLSMRYVSSWPSYDPNFRVEIPQDADAGNAKVTALFHIQNVQDDWKNVRLKVVVGAPHFASLPSPIPYPVYDTSRKLNNVAVAGAAPMQESFGGAVTQSESAEYYVYSFSDPVSINAGEEANMQAFSSSLPFKRENVWETYSTPQKYVLVNNTGSVPLASGVFRVYMGGEFAGEAASYTMTQPGYNAEINFADLYEIRAKHELDSQTAKQGNPAVGTSSVTTYTGKLTMENTASRPIKLKVREQMNSGDKVELVSSSIPAKKLSGNRLEWEVTIQPKEKLIVNFVYAVTYFDRAYY